MKSSFLALALALVTQTAFGAGAPLKAKPTSWWSDFSITPFGTLAHPNLTDAPVYGAGIDVGYYLNRTVSLHLANTVYDQSGSSRSAGGSEFRGSGGSGGWLDAPAIDETSILFRADLIRDSRERIVGYFVGSGDRDWVTRDWAFGVGVGAELRLTRNISLGADSRIRAWFAREKDLTTRGFVSIRF